MAHCKVTKEGEIRLGSCSMEVLFSHPARLFSVSLPLPSVSSDSTGFVAGVVWRHCGLAETWKPVWCSVLRCSSGLRGEISLAVPLTTRDWTIEIVLGLLTELHFTTRICGSSPEVSAAGEEVGDCFLIGISLFLIHQASSVFCSRRWWHISPGLRCHLYPHWLFKKNLKSNTNKVNDWEKKRQLLLSTFNMYFIVGGVGVEGLK